MGSAGSAQLGGHCCASSEWEGPTTRLTSRDQSIPACQGGAKGVRGGGGATNRHCSATVAPSLLSAAARGGRHSPGEPRKLVRRRKTRSLAQAPSGSALICVTFKATRCDAEMGLGELSAFGAPCRSDPRRGRRRKDCERDTPDFQEDAQSRRSATFLPPLPISTL